MKRSMRQLTSVLTVISILSFPLARAHAEPSCHERTVELGRWFASVAAEGDGATLRFFLAKRLELVDAPVAPAWVGGGLVVQVTANGVDVAGQLTEDRYVSG